MNKLQLSMVGSILQTLLSLKCASNQNYCILHIVSNILKCCKKIIHPVISYSNL